MTDEPTQMIDAYRACALCGKPFKVIRLDTAKYCSTNCRVKAWQKREREKQNADKGDT